MKPFAAVATTLPRSGIREIMALSAAMEDVIHLEVGQPDFDTPEHIVEAAVRHVRAGQTRYVANAGVTELRQAAARYFERRTGVATGVEHVLVTPGAVMSVATCFLAILEPGDEILLPDPGWPNYHMAASLVHARSVFYPLRPERQFLPTIEDLEERVSERTKLLLICTPSNPTGQVYDEQMMAALMDFARRRDLYVLSDEIYGEIAFDSEHVSALSYDEDERSIIVNGMSKAFAMTGFRVGFSRARPDYVELATKLQEPFVSCGVGFAQLAAAEGLDGNRDCVERMRLEYRMRRDVALDVLRQHELFRYSPGGAFYLLIDISSTGMDSREFALELLEKERVAVAPGNTFGAMCADHIRISIASTPENVRQGVERICRMIRSRSPA